MYTEKEKSLQELEQQIVSLISKYNHSHTQKVTDVIVSYIDVSAKFWLGKEPNPYELVTVDVNTTDLSGIL